MRVLYRTSPPSNFQHQDSLTATNKTLAERFDPKVLSTLKSLDLKAKYVVEGFLNGLNTSPFHGLSVEFSEYREYQPGDDLRHLDWRLFARNDRLYIKRHMEETNVRFYIICDTSSSMGYQGTRSWASKIECARIVAAALAWMLLRQNDAAGMLSYQDGEKGLEFISPSQRFNQFGALLHHLDSLTCSSSPCLERIMQNAARLFHRRSMILIFSDLLDPSENLSLSLKQLRFYGHDCLVFQVLDPDELEFSFDEQTVFEDLETGDRRITAPSLIRETYLSRFNEFMQGHRESLSSMGIPHCLIRTDKAPWPALAMFLAERKKCG